ncbi:MAG TPA: hypothetical protein VHE61_23775 [Opitutaceae bacterium]|nr:hypothetical protein [Opitutaceae bacterium]
MLSSFRHRLVIFLPLVLSLPPGTARCATQSAPGSTPVVSTDVGVRHQLRQLDRYLNIHPRMEQMLLQNASRLQTESFLQNNPEWADWLESQPGMGRAIKAERNFLLHRILTRSTRIPVLPQDVEAFDRFLDAHPEINRPVQQNPELLVDSHFLTAHPALATFYDSYPALSTILLELRGKAGNGLPAPRKAGTR